MCFHISLVLCANRRSYVKADPHFIFVVVISLFCHFEKKKMFMTHEKKKKKKKKKKKLYV